MNDKQKILEILNKPLSFERGISEEERTKIFESISKINIKFLKEILDEMSEEELRRIGLERKK